MWQYSFVIALGNCGIMISGLSKFACENFREDISGIKDLHRRICKSIWKDICSVTIRMFEEYTANKKEDCVMRRYVMNA